MLLVGAFLALFVNPTVVGVAFVVAGISDLAVSAAFSRADRGR